MKIGILEARTKDGKLIWAEGCDIYGYSYHQVIIPSLYFTEKELSVLEGENSDNINLGEREANHYRIKYTNFDIKIIQYDYN